MFQTASHRTEDGMLANPAGFNPTALARRDGAPLGFQSFCFGAKGTHNQDTKPTELVDRDGPRTSLPGTNARTRHALGVWLSVLHRHMCVAFAAV